MMTVAVDTIVHFVTISDSIHASDQVLMLASRASTHS